MHLNNPFGDCEPQAGSALYSRGRVVDLPKFLENALLISGRDAGPSVDHLNQKAVV
jgi:hypothetical protein